MTGMTKVVSRSLIQYASNVRGRAPMKRRFGSNQFKEMDSSLKSKTTAASSPSSSSSDTSTGDIPFYNQGPLKNSPKTKMLIAGGVVFLSLCAFGVTVTLPSYAAEPAKDSIRRKEELLKKYEGGSRGSMWSNLEKKSDRK